MAVFKIKYQKQGYQHVRVDIFEAPHWEHTFAKNGTLMFGKDSVHDFISAFGGLNDYMLIDEDLIKEQE